MYITFRVRLNWISIFIFQFQIKKTSPTWMNTTFLSSLLHFHSDATLLMREATVPCRLHLHLWWIWQRCPDLHDFPWSGCLWRWHPTLQNPSHWGGSQRSGTLWCHRGSGPTRPPLSSVRGGAKIERWGSIYRAKATRPATTKELLKIQKVHRDRITFKYS